MFDLDQQIDRWKSAFAKQAACSGDSLELESHLREEIARWLQQGVRTRSLWRKCRTPRRSHNDRRRIRQE